MSEQVSSRVSPTLHPDTVRAIEGFNDTTAPFVADVVSAFQDSYATIEKVHGAADLWRNNPAVTPENAILIVGKEAQKQQDRLLKRMDSASRCLAAAIEHTENALSEPLKERAGLGNLNQEVRNHAKGLNRDQRTKLINDAFRQGDHDTLAAILGAQPFLSGLMPEERDHYLHRFNSEQNPALVARLGVMKAAMEKLDRDATLILVEMQKAVGATPHRVNHIDSADRRAREALKIEPQA